MAGLPVYVEQPCRSTIDCILAARGSSLPLVLDESIVSADEVFRAKYEANAVSVNIKFGKLGGLTNLVRARDLLQDLNMAVSVEDMWGGDIITAATSHVAATTRPESLLMTPFFNDWTDGHLATTSRVRRAASAARRRGRGWASKWMSAGWGRRCSASNKRFLLGTIENSEKIVR